MNLLRAPSLYGTIKACATIAENSAASISKLEAMYLSRVKFTVEGGSYDMSDEDAKIITALIHDWPLRAQRMRLEFIDRFIKTVDGMRGLLTDEDVWSNAVGIQPIGMIPVSSLFVYCSYYIIILYIVSSI